MNTLNEDIIRMTLELDQAVSNLNPFNPSTIDGVTAALHKLNTRINQAAFTLGEISGTIKAVQDMIDLLDTTVGV